MFSNLSKPGFYLNAFLICLFFLPACKKDKTPKSTDKQMLSFTFKAANNAGILTSDLTADLYQDTIRFTLDQGSDMNLKPTITFTGKSVSPGNEVVQNFANPVIYKVAAEDGSVKAYPVKVTLNTVNTKIYFGSDDTYIYCLNAGDGTITWKYKTGGAIRATPVLGDNTIYAGSSDGYLYALDATTGALKWKCATAGTSIGEPVIANGSIFFIAATTTITKLISVDALSGTIKWGYQTNSTDPINNPTVSQGKVFVCLYFSGLNAFDQATGNLVWSNHTTQLTRVNPAVYNGQVYFGGETGIYSVDVNTGNQIWKYGVPLSSSCPTIANGTMYVCAGNLLLAIDPTSGLVRWQKTGYNNTNSPFYMNGRLYGNTGIGNLIAFNSGDGTTLWIKASICNGTISGANGVIYFGNTDNYFYAVDGITGNIKWKFLTGGPVYPGACVIGSDGVANYPGVGGNQN